MTIKPWREHWAKELDDEIVDDRQRLKWADAEIFKLRAALVERVADYYVVIDPSDNSCVYIASWPEACHEHINDAISEYAIEGAGKWVVRPLYLAANNTKES